MDTGNEVKLNIDSNEGVNTNTEITDVHGKCTRLIKRQPLK